MRKLHLHPAPPPRWGPTRPRSDVFLGYSYFGAHGEVKPGYIPYSSVDYGAIGSGAYYFTKYVGGEINFVAHPDGNNDGLYSASAGLIVRAPMQNFTLFGHGLVGGAKLGGPNSEAPATFAHEPYQWGPTLTAGGGMDYDLPFFDNKFSLRLFEADYRYVHTSYGPYTQIPTPGVLGGRANSRRRSLDRYRDALRPHHPAAAVTYACTVSPATVYPGDPVTATGTAMNLNPKKTATYSWTSTGGTISGSAPTATVDTKDAAPGTYFGQGSRHRGQQARSDGGLLGRLHRQAVRAANHLLLG